MQQTSEEQKEIFAKMSIAKMEFNYEICNEIGLARLLYNRNNEKKNIDNVKSREHLMGLSIIPVVTFLAGLASAMSQSYWYCTNVRQTRTKALHTIGWVDFFGTVQMSGKPEPRRCTQ
jgi:hypothetical protein